MEFSMQVLSDILSAAKAGHYAYAAALALVVGVTLARRYGAGKLPWLASDTGGAVLSFAGALGAAFASALATGGAVSLSLVWAAVGVAVTASGGYTLAKKLLINPILKPLAAKAPAWAQPIFALLLYLFESRAEAAARATAAGQAAVDKSPAKGTDEVALVDHDVA